MLQEGDNAPSLALVTGPVYRGGVAVPLYGGHDGTLCSKLVLPVASIHLKPDKPSITREVQPELGEGDEDTVTDYLMHMGGVGGGVGGVVSTHQ